jgi:hypothetical protein
MQRTPEAVARDRVFVESTERVFGLPQQLLHQICASNLEKQNVRESERE